MSFSFDAFEFKHSSGCWLKVNINYFGGNTNINCSIHGIKIEFKTEQIKKLKSFKAHNKHYFIKMSS